MEDNGIIELYFARREDAITETQTVYGRKLDGLSFRIVKDVEDAKECVNDTYLKAWNSIPPQKPTFFYAYLAKICRFLCFGKLDYKNAQKRNMDVIALTHELEQCIPDQFSSVHMEQQEIGELFTSFLRMLPQEQRLIFMRRYWFSDSIAEIAKQYQVTESKVKTSLHRTRKKLRIYLEKEGVKI